MCTMYEVSRIDLYVESLIMWAATGRICEDVYFTVRHHCFRLLAALHYRWLPFIRQAEKELKPYDRHLRPRYTLRERLGLGLRWPLLILSLPVVATLVLAFACDFPLLVQKAAETSSLTGVLKTTGTILATLTAILLGVTALAIQTTLASLPGANFLLGAFGRKQGFVPVAALLLGTLVSIIGGVVFADVMAQQTLNDWVLVTALTAFISALLLFDLLRRTLQGLGQTDVAELLRTELSNNWRLYTRTVFRTILHEIRLRDECAKLGFARHVCSESETSEKLACHLRKNGHVATVDTSALRRIATILRIEPIEPDLNLSYKGWLGRRGIDVPCVTIPEDGEVTADQSLAILVPGDLDQSTEKRDGSCQVG